MAISKDERLASVATAAVELFGYATSEAGWPDAAPINEAAEIGRAAAECLIVSAVSEAAAVKDARRLKLIR